MESIEGLNPVLLRATHFNGYDFKEGYELERRVVYDYEIEYYLESRGGVVVDGEYIEFLPGDIGIRKPGQVVQGIMPYSCYTIFIDLNGQWQKGKNYNLGREKEKQEPNLSALIKGLPRRIEAQKNTYTVEVIKKIYQDSLEQTELGRLNIKLNLLLLLKAIIESSNSDIICPRGHESIKIVINYIRENYMQSINMQELIKMSGFSKPYFYILFQNYTGKTPNQFIVDMRIEKAKYLLAISNTPITEVAYQCGYDDCVYFSYIFKRNTNKTPSEFRMNSKY